MEETEENMIPKVRITRLDNALPVESKDFEYASSIDAEFIYREVVNLIKLKQFPKAL